MIDKELLKQSVEKAIAGTCARLRAYDSDEARRAMSDPGLMLELVRRHFHCG